MEPGEVVSANEKYLVITAFESYGKSEKTTLELL